MAEMKFEIKQHMCVLSERKNGWKKELNRVSWNDADPKWDIREWIHSFIVNNTRKKPCGKNRRAFYFIVLVLMKLHHHRKNM